MDSVFRPPHRHAADQQAVPLWDDTTPKGRIHWLDTIEPGEQWWIGWLLADSDAHDVAELGDNLMVVASMPLPSGKVSWLVGKRSPITSEAQAELEVDAATKRVKYSGDQMIAVMMQVFQSQPSPTVKSYMLGWDYVDKP